MLSEPVIPGLRERLLLLRRVNSFGRLNDHALLLIAEHARVRSFADGAYALEEGPIENVHVVASGRFKVTRRGKFVADVPAGGAIGVLSGVAQDDVGVMAQSIGRSRTLEIPLDIFLGVNEESFPVMRVGLRVFSGQLLDAHRHFSLEYGGSAEVLSENREMGLIERVIEFSERGLFRTWNANALFDVARGATVVSLAAGDSLWQPGEPAKACYHVVRGRLASREDGRAETFGMGGMLGLLEMLSERSFQHTPVAHEDCLLLRISSDRLWAAFDTHRDLAFALVTRLARALLAD